MPNCYTEGPYSNVHWRHSLFLSIPSVRGLSNRDSRSRWQIPTAFSSSRFFQQPTSKPPAQATYYNPLQPTTWKPTSILSLKGIENELSVESREQSKESGTSKECCRNIKNSKYSSYSLAHWQDRTALFIERLFGEKVSALCPHHRLCSWSERSDSESVWPHTGELLVVTHRLLEGRGTLCPKPSGISELGTELGTCTLIHRLDHVDSNRSTWTHRLEHIDSKTLQTHWLDTHRHPQTPLHSHTDLRISCEYRPFYLF